MIDLSVLLKLTLILFITPLKKRSNHNAGKVVIILRVSFLNSINYGSRKTQTRHWLAVVLSCIIGSLFVIFEATRVFV